jgi:hypothetical protein
MYFGDKAVIKNGDLVIQKSGVKKKFDTIRRSQGQMQPRGFRRDWKQSFRAGAGNQNTTLESIKSPRSANRHRIFGDHRL